MFTFSAERSSVRSSRTRLSMSSRMPRTAASGLPTVEIPQGELDAGIPAFELLKRAGLCATNSEARRLINGGGGRLNDEPIADETRPVNANDLNADGVIKLSAGKKRHALVRAV